MTAKIKLFFILQQILSVHIAHAQDINSRIKQARLSGTIGDPVDDMAYFPGAIFTLFHNDSIGNTDKHNSNATYLAYLWMAQKHSLKLNLNWRFFSTNTRKPFSPEETLSRPGRFADTISLESSYQYMFSDNIALGIEGGFSHIADHGAKKIQMFIHKMIGAHTHSLHYLNQPDGIYGSGGLNISYYYEPVSMFSLTQHFWQQLGMKYNAFMSDFWIMNSSSMYQHKDYILTLSTKSTFQLATEIFAKDGARPWRHEFSIGAQLWKYWTPQFKWMTGFLNNDKQSQAYIDVLNLNYPF